MDGHSPTNALGKNNGTEAQVATVPLQQAYTDGDPDLFNDLVLGDLPSKNPTSDPQVDVSLCECPGPGYSSCEQAILKLFSSDTSTSPVLFHSFEQYSSDCGNLTSTSNDCLGFHCHGQSLQCDQSADDCSGLLSHGWSHSSSCLSGSMGHSKLLNAMSVQAPVVMRCPKRCPVN